MDLSKDNPDELQHKLLEKFFHSLPYMFFFCLPLLALLLKLLYIRRNEFYFVSHIIFIVHYFCTVFLLFLLFKIAELLGKPGKIIAFFIFLGFLVYLYKSMRRFYKQRRAKTVIKFLLLVFIGGMLISILTVTFLINSFLNTAS